MLVVDVEANLVEGHGRPHVFSYFIDFRSSMLCINIGYRVFLVLGLEVPMLRFHGLCDGKIMVKKNYFFFEFCVEISKFLALILVRDM